MPVTSFSHFPKPVLGLAGAPGSGKSAVARALAALGCTVIDADAMARTALETPESKAQLRAKWGESVFDDAGSPDRAAIAKRVFEAPAERHWLEQLIHPQVHINRKIMREKAFEDKKVVAVVEDCPLLFEMNMAGDCDAILFVDAPLADRQRRVLAARGWSAKALADRENSQWPLDIKREKSDYAITNDADWVVLRRRVGEILDAFLSSRRGITAAE